MDNNRLEYEKEYHDNVDKWHVERDKIRSKFSKGLFQIPLADAWKSVDVKDKVVLDYGCGEGLATKNMLELGARHVEAIDISEGMIEQAKENNNNTDKAYFQVMNAEELKFKDDTFDIIFGGAILHHLDLDKALNEIKRTLKPSGYAVFIEPLGHNPVINHFRDKTPDARTPFEHPLLKKDIKLAKQIFREVQTKEYFCLSIIPLGIRSKLPEKVFDPLFNAFYALDRVFLDTFKCFSHYSWMCLIKLIK